jgi:hypothetical protein
MHAHARENPHKPPIIRTRQRCTRFNRHGMNAVIEQIKADNMIGLRESCIGGSAIAFQETKCLIARRLRPDLRRLRAKRRRAINHGGQGIVAYLNRLRRVTSGRGAGGDNQGNRLTQMSHAIRCQHRSRRHYHGRHTRDHRRAGQWCQIIGGKIGGSENTHHTWHGARCCCGDLMQYRMGMG